MDEAAVAAHAAARGPGAVGSFGGGEGVLGKRCGERRLRDK